MNKTLVKKFIDKLIEAELSGNEKNIEECLDFKKQHLPKHIYKYRSCNSYSIENLKNNTIHLSFSYKFNDPFDCVSVLTYEQLILTGLIQNDKEIFFNSYPDDIREDMIKRLSSGEKLKNVVNDHFACYPSDKKYFNHLLKEAKDELHKFVSSLGDEFKTKFLLCCFSATVNNNLMWAHYSKSHTGFCIEYDISTLPANSSFKHSLYPVIYTKTPILAKLRFQDYTDCTKDMLTLLNKSIDWNYEKEFRMLYPPNFSSLYDMPIKPSCLYLGNKISNINQNKIIKIAKEMKIPIRKMQLKANSFNLESYAL